MIKNKVIASIVITLGLIKSSFAFCFDYAAKYYGVSPHLLMAIAKVESGMNPYAKNINKNGTVDYGLMQINSRWHPYLRRHGISPKWLADPCYNVLVGAMVLKSCINTFGYNWKAVDCYNKGRKARGNSEYVYKVYKSLVKIANAKRH